MSQDTPDDSGSGDMDDRHGEPAHGPVNAATGPEDSVPAYRTVRVTASDDPLAALADTEAWLARDRYPRLLNAGPAMFGVVREREEGGWVVLDGLTGQTPQEARDSMGSRFRRRAKECEEAGDQSGYDTCMAAAERMEWERLDELTVLGDRYRVARAEAFIRSGPDGPEPPRTSDPDHPRPGRGHERENPSVGFVLDPARATGMSEGILKVDLLSLVGLPRSVPRAMREDALTAARTHPGGVLLPATFMTAECENGTWRPDSRPGSGTPQAARDSLTFMLRVMLPWEQRLDPEEREPYTAAADRLDAKPSNDLEVAGRHFRVVRVERLVRFGPDGPEGPRPSDPDPQPPVKVHDQQLRAEGIVIEEEDEDEVPAERTPLDENTRRLTELVQEEEARIRALRARDGDRRGR